MKKIAKIIVLSIAMLFVAPHLKAQFSLSVGISVHIAPPAIPVYVQPECPTDGYLWQPGYWAYGDDGYYWVPGAWVAPPSYGLLWTPGYWGYDNAGIYVFHSGYWGPHIGFYGGVNYGFGYYGSGFGGGIWVGHSFRYNTAVFNVNRTVIHNTYINRTVVRTNFSNRTSFNGGPNGIHATPNPQERMAMNEHHIQPTRQQISHNQSAAQNRSQYASVNHGRPSVTAVSRPGARSFGSNNNRSVNNNHPATVNHAAAPSHSASAGRTASRPASQRSFTPRAAASRPQPSHQGFGGGHAAAVSRPAPAPRPAAVSRPAPRPMASSRPAPAARPAGGFGGGNHGGGGGSHGGGGRRH